MEANYEKIIAIIEMKSSRTLKEIQRLTGKLMTLNQLIS